MTTAKLYKVGDTVVEATLSPGGGFYNIRIPETGGTMRVLADVFETVAKIYASAEEKK